MNWLEIIAAAILLWAVLAIALELNRFRLAHTEMLGSIANALWRIHDEISALNKELRSAAGTASIKKDSGQAGTGPATGSE